MKKKLFQTEDRNRNVRAESQLLFQVYNQYRIKRENMLFLKKTFPAVFYPQG